VLAHWTNRKREQNRNKEEERNHAEIYKIAGMREKASWRKLLNQSQESFERIILKNLKVKHLWQIFVLNKSNFEDKYLFWNPEEIKSEVSATLKLWRDSIGLSSSLVFNI
jgi:hypothetical protein